MDERKSDIGGNNAYEVNMKETVGTEKDYKDRSRNFYDSTMAQIIKLGESTTVSLAHVQAGMTLAFLKQVENVTSVNATDFAERDIINSPWAEAMKTLMVEVMKGKDAAG